MGGRLVEQDARPGERKEEAKKWSTLEETTAQAMERDLWLVCVSLWFEQRKIGSMKQRM